MWPGQEPSKLSEERLCPVHREVCDERAACRLWALSHSSTKRPWMNGAQAVSAVLPPIRNLHLANGTRSGSKRVPHIEDLAPLSAALSSSRAPCAEIEIHTQSCSEPAARHFFAAARHEAGGCTFGRRGLGGASACFSGATPGTGCGAACRAPAPRVAGRRGRRRSGILPRAGGQIGRSASRGARGCGRRSTGRREIGQTGQDH